MTVDTDVRAVILTLHNASHKYSQGPKTLWAEVCSDAALTAQIYSTVVALLRSLRCDRLSGQNAHANDHTCHVQKSFNLDRIQVVTIL